MTDVVVVTRQAVDVVRIRQTDTVVVVRDRVHHVRDLRRGPQGPLASFDTEEQGVAADADLSRLKGRAMYQLPADETVNNTGQTITFLSGEFVDIPEVAFTGIDDYLVKQNEVWVTGFTPYDHLWDDGNAWSYGEAGTLAAWAQAVLLPRNAIVFNAPDVPTAVDGFCGFVHGSLGDALLAETVDPTIYYVVGYKRTDADYVTGTAAVSFPGDDDPAYPAFDPGEHVPVEADGSFEVFFADFEGDVVLKLFRVADDVQVGESWLDGAMNDYREGLSTSFTHITDAEYLLETRRVPSSDQVLFTESAAGIKLIRLLTATETLAYTSHRVGRIRSYDFPLTDDGYEVMRNRGYIYDQALYLLARLSGAEGAQADLAAIGLVESQYTTGKVGAWPFSVNIISLAGDAYIRNGAVAWALYALCRYAHGRGTVDASVTLAITQAADYLVGELVPSGDGLGMVPGGYGQYGASPTYTFDPDAVITWISTEHNIDAFFALSWATEITGTADYLTAAQGIATGLMRDCWDTAESYFRQGVNDTASALDCMTWGAMFLKATGRLQEARLSMRRALANYQVTVDGVTGFKPYDPEDGYPDAIDTVWPEGTLGAAVAFYQLGDLARWRTLIASLQALRDADGLLPYVNSPDARYELTDHPSVIGLAWHVIANDAPDGVLLVLPEQGPTGAAAPEPTVGEKVFVLSSAATTAYLYSIDGATWTEGTFPFSSTFQGIAYNGTTYVVVASPSAKCLTSTDGLNWTQRDMPASSQWRSVTWNGVVFCAVCASPGRVATSADGITWAQQGANSVAVNATSITSSPSGKMCFICAGLVTKTSDDNGASWATGTFPGSGDGWRKVIYDQTLAAFVAVADKTNSFDFATSAAGLSWAGTDNAISDAFTSITTNGVVLVAIATGSGGLSSSVNGIDWTKRSSSSANWRAVTWNGKYFLAVASSVTSGGSARSLDGIAWEFGNLPISATWDFSGPEV